MDTGDIPGDPFLVEKRRLRSGEAAFEPRGSRQAWIGLAYRLRKMFDFFPIWALLGYFGLLAYVAFAKPKPKQPPGEPWYMK